MTSSARRTVVVLLVVTLVLAASLAMAADAAKPPASKEQGFWSRFLDSTFGLILLFVFLPVLITTFVAARQRDRCLKTFHKFHSTVRSKEGKAIWGRMRVFSKGLVLAYNAPVEKTGAPTKTSYMMYEPDMENVFAIFRFHDQLTDQNKRRRDRQINRLAYPGLLRRLWRKTRNLINTLRDAFNKAIGAFLGQMQKTKPGSKAMKTGGKQIEGVGTELLGQVANQYEPLLESHIGSPVVLELAGPAEGEVREYAGQLGEYSATYLMVLDIDADIEEEATLNGAAAFDDCVRVKTQQDHVEINNGLRVDVRVTSIIVGGKATELDVTVAADTTEKLPVTLSELTPAPPPDTPDGEQAPPPQPTPTMLRLIAHRRADVMAPRTHAIVRHGGIERQRDKPSLVNALKLLRHGRGET